MKIFSKALVIVTAICLIGISCGGETGMDEDAAKVAAAKKALVLPAETDRDLDLPIDLDGVAISWVSSDETVISNTGIVAQQQYDTEVTLTATLKLGNAVETKEFMVIVLGTEETGAEKVAAAKDALAIPAETDCDLDLPIVLDGVAISWSSSDEEVISNTGAVTRQLHERQARLTATLTLGSEIDTKEFTVRVTAVLEEEAELIQLSNWSMSSSSTQNRIIMKYPDENAVFYCRVDNGLLNEFPYAINDPRDILELKNINVAAGSTISWNPLEIDAKGQLLYYVDHAFIEIIVKLEENIIGYVVIEAFRNTISNLPDIKKSVLFPKTDGVYQNISEEYVKDDIEKSKIINTDVKKIAEVKARLTITKYQVSWQTGCYYLPSSYLGASINWTSSDEALINSNTGIVIRPLNYDTDVTLTATLTLGSASAIKEFNVRLTGLPFIEIPTKLVDDHYWSNPAPPLPNRLDTLYQDGNVVYNCTVDLGYFYLGGSDDVPMKNVSVYSGNPFYWKPDGEIEWTWPNLPRPFIEIILKLEETIIGYTVIQINTITTLSFSTIVRKSVIFPQLDGEYQNVSEEYVKAAMSTVIQMPMGQGDY